MQIINAEALVKSQTCTQNTRTKEGEGNILQNRKHEHIGDWQIRPTEMVLLRRISDFTCFASSRERNFSVHRKQSKTVVGFIVLNDSF